ncbi:hypothetical protein GH714_012732 [Hevea brasiliensis]|uniref:RING-type domain-containing protein n=1 Tax=Hevea brasiliensis TaxID=3981 RepID=A0A6A6L142_HEVBR|nr:hypothetical protein GH714_012732 [Hevea brasiliensis]
MTSASELFYQRRSRVGRATTADLELDPSSSDRNFHLNYARRHHHHYDNHSRYDWTDVILPGDLRTCVACAIGFLLTLLQLYLFVIVYYDRGPVSLIKAKWQGVIWHIHREYTFGDDIRVADAGDWGTDIASGWSARGAPLPDPTFQTERLQFVQESYRKKPPGLTQEDLASLPFELYSSLERGVEEEICQVSWDCSICLESFKEGDKLIRLPCEHRFHAACLNPWVRTCGDCPYCRRDIVVSSHKS